MQIITERGVNSMKKRYFTLTILLSMLLVLASVSSAFATVDPSKTYGYTVKVYAGEHGEFADGSKKITVSVKAGDKVNIAEIASEAGFKVTDTEYYCRGYRETGHDNDESPSLVAFDADEDVSYEAAYGIKGGMVKYTVMYLDDDGDPVRDADEFYGMAGDKPVVSYKYVDGYQPNVYNLTKTLSSDESQNVFAFSYIKNRAAADDDDDQAGAANAANGNNANANAQGNAANGNNANAAGNAADGNNANGNAAGAANGNGNAPAEIVDLDDNATPQAENAGDEEDGISVTEVDESETPKAGISPAAIGGVAVLIAAIAAVAAALAKRRKDGEEDEDESTEKSE